MTARTQYSQAYADTTPSVLYVEIPGTATYYHILFPTLTSTPLTLVYTSDTKQRHPYVDQLIPTHITSMDALRQHLHAHAQAQMQQLVHTRSTSVQSMLDAVSPWNEQPVEQVVSEMMCVYA